MVVSLEVNDAYLNCRSAKMKLEAHSQPRVTIGMPAYNAEDFVQKSIESLLGQSFIDFELVISDNASTDRTGQICREYAARDARVRYACQPKNIGPVANFNWLLNEARGEYFMWAATDDFWEPTFLERCTQVLDCQTLIDMVYSPHRGYNHVTGERTECGEVLPSCISNKRNNLIVRFLNPVPNLIYGLFRRRFLADVIGGVGNFDFSDLFLTYQAAVLGRIHVIEDSLYWAGTKTVARRPYSLTGDQISVGPFVLRTARLIWSHFANFDRAVLLLLFAWVAGATRRNTRRTVKEYDHKFGSGS
jgi:glycosyltransferase involved in cell wall biosynthesis